jgi:hypothetical protein
VKIFSRRFLQIGFLIFMTIALAFSAQATTFSNASLKGGYSFLTNLWTANVNTNQFAMVGVMTFDGAGNVTGSYTQNSGGSVTAGILGGTYTVNSNGTGAIVLTAGLTAQFAITLLSTAGGVADGVRLLQTNDSNNEVISGTALLQSSNAETYSVASLKGNFAFQGNQWTADVTEAQSSTIGAFKFDGTGGFKGSETTMYAGELSSGPFTGTYTVNSDGTGTLSGTSKHNHHLQFAFALNSVTAGQAKGLQVVATEPGNGNGNYVDTGTMLKQ